MEELNEALLESWLRLSTRISNSRLVSSMSYNESLVCHILYRNLKDGAKKMLTATDLCEKTKILKSQMNRILNKLEEKKMIIRTRSTKDKRQIFVSFNMDRAEEYEKQHTKIMELLNTLIGKIGKDAANDAVRLFHNISDAADQVLYE